MVTGQFTGKSCLVGAAAGRDIPNQFTGRCSPNSLTVHIQHWKMEEMVPRWLAVNSQSWGGGENGRGALRVREVKWWESKREERERELELENFILSGL